MIRKLTVIIKKLLSHFILMPSFCKDCGRNVHDFIASDEIWKSIESTIKNGHVLCYDCFCEHCEKQGLPSVYRLEVMTHEHCD